MFKKLVSILMCTFMLLSLCCINVSAEVLTAEVPTEKVFVDDYTHNGTSYEKQGYYTGFYSGDFPSSASTSYGDTGAMCWNRATTDKALKYDFQRSGQTPITGFTEGIIEASGRWEILEFVVKGGADLNNLVELKTTKLQSPTQEGSWPMYRCKISDIPSDCRYITISPAKDDTTGQYNQLMLKKFTLYKSGVSMINRSGVYDLGADAESSALTVKSEIATYSYANNIPLEASVVDVDSCTGVKFYANDKFIGNGSDSDGDGVYTLNWRPALNQKAEFDNTYNGSLTPLDAGVYSVYAVASYTGVGDVRSDARKISLNDSFDRVKLNDSVYGIINAEGGFRGDDTITANGDPAPFIYQKPTVKKGEETVTVVAPTQDNSAIKITSLAGVANDPGIITSKSIQSLKSYFSATHNSGIYEIYARMMIDADKTKTNTAVRINFKHSVSGDKYGGGIIFDTNNHKIGYVGEGQYTTATGTDFDKPVALEYGKMYDIKMYYDSANTKAIVYINGERVTNDWVKLGNYDAGNSANTTKNSLSNVLITHRNAAPTADQHTYVYAFSLHPVEPKTAAQLKDISVDASELQYIASDASTVTAVFNGEVTNNSLEIFDGATKVGTYTATEADNTYTYDIGEANLQAGKTYTLKIGGNYAAQIRVADDAVKVTDFCCDDFRDKVAGDTINAEFKYENNTGKVATFTPIAAIYNGDVLQDVIIGDAEVVANKIKGAVTMPCELPEGFDAQTSTIKLFAWDDMQNLIPLGGTLEFSKDVFANAE